MYSDEQIQLNKSKFIKISKNGGLYYLIPAEILNEPNDRWIYYRDVYKKLESLGTDFWTYCDRYIFGINSIEERPKCKCGAELWFDRSSVSYRTICSTCSQSAKLSKILTEKWKDPNSIYNTEEYRSKMAESVKIAKNTPEAKKQVSEQMTKLWSDEEFRTKMLQIRNEESYVSNMREGHKKMYQDYISDPKNVEAELNYRRTHPFMANAGEMDSRFGHLYFDSSYEKLFIEICENITEVTYLIREPFMIKYFNNEENRERRYIPDFLITINNLNLLVEIKNSHNAQLQNTKDKSIAAEEYCKHNGLYYVLLTEYELYPEYIKELPKRLATAQRL